MNKKIFLRKMRYILLVAVIAAMWMIAGGCGKKQKVLDVNKYLNISFEGYDGYGTMDCIFDNSKIDDDKELLPEDFSYYTMVYDLFSIDETSGLSNGDTVKISWNKDILEELSEKCDKAKLKYDDAEIEVKGLKEVDKIDMFSDLKVEYSGIAPNVSATCSSKKFPWVDFEIDKRENLSSGDTITVSIPESSINEEFIEKYNGVPADSVDVEDFVSILERAKKDYEEFKASVKAPNIDDYKAFRKVYADYFKKVLERAKKLIADNIDTIADLSDYELKKIFEYYKSIKSQLSRWINDDAISQMSPSAIRHDLSSESIERQKKQIANIDDYFYLRYIRDYIEGDKAK